MKRFTRPYYNPFFCVYAILREQESHCAFPGECAGYMAIEYCSFCGQAEFGGLEAMLLVLQILGTLASSSLGYFYATS